VIVAVGEERQTIRAGDLSVARGRHELDVVLRAAPADDPVGCPEHLQKAYEVELVYRGHDQQGNGSSHDRVILRRPGGATQGPVAGIV